MSELTALFEAHKAVTPRFKVVQVRGEGGGSKAVKNEHLGEAATEELKTRRKKTNKEPDPREGRTVFVGNIPITCTKKQIKQLFRQYGCVETVRVRSMQVESGTLPAVVAKRMHKQLAGSSFNAYVVFSSGADAEKALALDGTLMEGRHVRVDLAGRSQVHAQQRSVFVGNLPFTADEEVLREAFSDCGEVEAVRIVRDAKTGAGKGFGFVIFKEQSGVLFALKQNNRLELEGRLLRVFKSRDVPRTKARQHRQKKRAGPKSVKAGRKTRDPKPQRTVRETRDSKPQRTVTKTRDPKPQRTVRETRVPKPQRTVRETRVPKPRRARMEGSSEPRCAKPRHQSGVRKEDVRKEDGICKGAKDAAKFKRKKLYKETGGKRQLKKTNQ